MGEPVLSDPQYGVAKILRPFKGFEAVYEGKTVLDPIAFSENGEPLDPNAGEPGYAPNLLRGLSVPYGARLTLWLPNVSATMGGPPATTFWFYQWRITVRMRNVFDFRQSRIPFHYPKQSAGAPDTSTPPTARVVIPAATNILLYTQTDPTPLSTPTSFAVTESVAPEPLSMLPPFLPNGSRGAIQQGLLDPATFPAIATIPLYYPYEIPAVFGDEILLDVTRQSEPNLGTPSAHPNWQFTTGDEIDAILSDLFGNGAVNGPFPAIGVFALTGVAPGPGQARNP